MNANYEETLFYQINSCAKYFDKLSEQFFKELGVGISGIEHFALSVIMQTPDCCQRDLAKVILKDRANTGKFAKKLEEKGLIKIELRVKNNKPVKILTVTDKGKELCEQIRKKVKPLVNKIKGEITEEKLSMMIEGLKEFQKIVKKNVKINI